MKELIIKPRFIHLYNEPTARALEVKEISDYLEEELPNIEIDNREEFFIHHLSHFSPKIREEMINSLAKKIAWSRISNFEIQEITFAPLPAEIEYEKKRIEKSNHKSFGILYHGFKLQRVLAELIPREEKDSKHLHIIFTNQLFGTWSRSDGRYHARVSIYGLPTIISTAGLVEAPAKPKEYYLLKREYHMLGMRENMLSDLKEKFQGRFIDYDDSRTTEVVKGYAMQALFYYLVGDPFCRDRNCRLYNAHWQEDVIQAQLKSLYEFCSFHQQILDFLKSKTLNRFRAREITRSRGRGSKYSIEETG